MSILSQLQDLLSTLSTTTEREKFTAPLLSIYEKSKTEKESDNDPVTQFLTNCLMYDCFWALTQQPYNKQQELINDNHKYLTNIQSDPNARKYFEILKELSAALQSEFDVLIPSEIFSEIKTKDSTPNNLTVHILKSINYLAKQNKFPSDLFSTRTRYFIKFCSDYINEDSNKKNIFWRKLSNYILHRYYLFNLYNLPTAEHMGTFFEEVYRKRDDKTFISYEQLADYCLFYDLFKESSINALVNFIIKDIPLISTESSLNYTSSVTISKFLLLAIDLDYYDYPGFYIVIVQLLKYVDYNYFKQLFNSNPKNYQVESEIYKTVNPETRFENACFTPRYNATHPAGTSMFIRMLSSYKDNDKDTNKKVLNYISYFCFWEMASKLPKSEERNQLMNDFYNAAKTEDWKDTKVLISFLNRMAAINNFIQVEPFAEILFKDKLSPLEMDVRNAAVFLMTRNESNAEGAQLTLINLLDTIRDQKLLCKPDRNKHYEFKNETEESTAAKDADNEIERCRNNRKVLFDKSDDKKITGLDQGFRYDFIDDYLSDQWIDTLATWNRPMTCRLFHEADMKMVSENKNSYYDKRHGLHWYYINYGEDHNAANLNLLNNNFLLLIRHQKTHGQHHAVSNLLNDEYSKSGLINALKDGKKYFTDKLTAAIETDKDNSAQHVIQFHIKQIDYIANILFKKLSAKNPDHDFSKYLNDNWDKQDFSSINDLLTTITFANDFTTEEMEYSKVVLSSMYAVEEDFMYRHINQVNLYLVYMAMRLVNYIPLTKHL